MFLSHCRANREVREFFMFFSQVPEWGLEWALFLASSGDIFEWMVISLADRFRGKGFDRIQAEVLLRSEKANRILQKLRGLRQYYTRVRKLKEEKKKAQDIIRDIVSGRINPYKAPKDDLISMGFNYRFDGQKEEFYMLVSSSSSYCYNDRHGQGHCDEMDRWLYGGLLTSNYHRIEIHIMRGNWYDTSYRANLKFAMGITANSKNCYNGIEVKEITEEEAVYKKRVNKGSRNTSDFSLTFATNDEDIASVGLAVGYILSNALMSVPSGYISDELVSTEGRMDIYNGLVDSDWIITCSYDAGTLTYHYRENRRGKIRLQPIVLFFPSQIKYSDVYNNKKQCNFIKLSKEKRAKREDLRDIFVSFSFNSFSGGNQFFWFSLDKIWGKGEDYYTGHNSEYQQGVGVGMSIRREGSRYKISLSSQSLSHKLYVYKTWNYTVEFASDGFKLPLPSEERKEKKRKKRKVIC